MKFGVTIIIILPLSTRVKQSNYKLLTVQLLCIFQNGKSVDSDWSLVSHVPTEALGLNTQTVHRLGGPETH